MKKFISKYSSFALVGTGIILFSMTVETEAEVVAWALASVSSVVLLYMYEQIRQSRKLEKLQSEKLAAELSLLKSQVTPHFFFNTLNNLYSLSLTKSDDAPKLILRLSEVMRYIIYKAQKSCVPLSEDLDHVKGFIELQKLRMKDDLAIHYTEKIENNDKEVAPLLFITLVENAFKHGAEKLGKNCFIRIVVKEAEELIKLEIENNFDPEIETDPGIGLDNLRNRLELLYPRSHKLEINIDEDRFRAVLTIEGECKS